MPQRDMIGNGGATPDVSMRVVRKRAAPLASTLLDGLLLDALSHCQRPLSAYDLAEVLRGKHHGPAVMSIYRALDRLVARRLVQKVETLSAYRLRDEPAGVLMICTLCGRTESLAVPIEHDRLTRRVRSQGFDIGDMALEATGWCGACRPPAGAGDDRQ